jgi:HEAT repeat protein
VFSEEYVNGVYAALAAGETGVDFEGLTKRLQVRGCNQREAANPLDRIGALRVAAALGSPSGLVITDALAHDVSVDVRGYVLEQAKAARQAGLPIIRRIAEDSDAKLAAAALGLLRAVVDRQAVTLSRRLLTSPHPTVRCVAVDLLGHIGGKATIVNVRALTVDPIKAVSKAASQTLKRLNGELERDTPAPWWNDEEAIVLPPPPTPLPKEVLERLPMPEPELETPEELEPALPAAPKFDFWTTEWANLPETLPSEPRALLKLLGMIAREHRLALVSALEGAAPDTMGLEVHQGAKSKDHAVVRGAILYASEAGRSDLMLVLRQLNGHSEPGVRAAIAEAIGAIGKISSFTSLLPLLGDGDVGVRATAIVATTDLALTLKRQSYAVSQIQQLRDDPEKVICDLVALQLERLGA